MRARSLFIDGVLRGVSAVFRVLKRFTCLPVLMSCFGALLPAVVVEGDLSCVEVVNGLPFYFRVLTHPIHPSLSTACRTVAVQRLSSTAALVVLQQAESRNPEQGGSA